MDDTFNKSIRKAKIYAVLYSTISLAAVVFTIVAIGLLVERAKAGIVFAILAVISAGAVGLMYKKETSSKNLNQLYRFSIRADSYDAIVSMMDAEQISAEIAYCQATVDDFRMRFLLKHIEFLDSPKSLFNDARRAMQKYYPADPMISLYDAAKMIRTEILVCDVSSHSIADWLTRDFSHNMLRAESILRICVVLEEQACYASMNVFGLELSRINKYLYAVTFFKHTLQ